MANIYEVLYNGKPATLPDGDPYWHNNVFSTYEEALDYAAKWIDGPSATELRQWLKPNEPFNYSGNDTLEIDFRRSPMTLKQLVEVLSTYLEEMGDEEVMIPLGEYDYVLPIADVDFGYDINGSPLVHIIPDFEYDKSTIAAYHLIVNAKNSQND